MIGNEDLRSYLVFVHVTHIRRMDNMSPETLQPHDMIKLCSSTGTPILVTVKSHFVPGVYIPFKFAEHLSSIFRLTKKKILESKTPPVQGFQSCVFNLDFDLEV
jgi:hypothetical protein